MGHPRALPWGLARGTVSRSWRITFVLALAALSASATLLMLTIFAMLEVPTKPVSANVDSVALLPLHELSSAIGGASSAVANAGIEPVATAVPAVAEVEPVAEVRGRSPITVPPANITFRPAADIVDARLQRALDETVAEHGGGISIVVLRLADGAAASVNPGAQWYAASLFKLAVLYEIERQEDAGVIARDERIYLTAGDFAEDLGTADWLPTADDGSLSIAEALEAMVTFSDNTTAVALMHYAGTASVDATMIELGLTSTSVNTTDLPTTAADMALLMEALAIGRGLSDDAANDARGLLLRQRTRSGIPAGLPADIPVGNKTGTWPGDTHDVAFVVAPGGTYIVAILTDRDWGWDTISEVSAAIYAAMTISQ